MSKLRKAKYYLSGIATGAILFSGIAYASTSINVDIKPITYYFDGIVKTPDGGQQGFIYKGTTYVPLRFMSESLGKQVEWDGAESSIYVGKVPERKSIYMEQLHPYASTQTYISGITSFTTNMNATYQHGFKFGDKNAEGTFMLGKMDNKYQLNGQYYKFEAFVAPESIWSKSEKPGSAGFIKIYGDNNQLIYDSKTISSNIKEPLKISVSLKGVNSLRITGEGYEIGLLDAKFIQ